LLAQKEILFMHSNQLKLVVNAAALFVSASILEMTLHEAGHFVAGLLLHLRPTLYHNYVSWAKIPLPFASIYAASAGPVMSLITAMVTLLWLQAGNPNGFARMFLWYFSFSGFVGFFGYLMIAPFFSYGDTGYVLRALECPMWLIITLAITGVLILVGSIRLLAPHMVSLMDEKAAVDKRARGQFVLSTVLYVLLIGIPLTALLNLPTPTFLSILAPLMSPWSLLYAYGYYMRGKPFRNQYGEQLSDRWMPVGWWILFIALILLNRLLVFGYSVS
jgi:hypothetical protein